MAAITALEPKPESTLRTLVEGRWPWRLHATYDETRSRALDVYERASHGQPIGELTWFPDHCETIADCTIDRIAALGGGVANAHGQG